jgi:hypothetical protein
MQLMGACYRFSSGHYAFFIWQTNRLRWQSEMELPAVLDQAARVLVSTRFGRTGYPLPGASEIQRALQSKVRR